MKSCFHIIYLGVMMRPASYMTPISICLLGYDLRYDTHSFIYLVKKAVS